MKFSINQQVFLKSLSVVNRSLLSKSNLPILANVLISAKGGKIEFVTTSLETATRVEIAGKVTEEGRTTLPSRAVNEFVSQLNEVELSFEKLGEEVLISAPGFKARFATMAAEEFPAIPKVDSGKQVEVVGQDFVEGINKVVFCAAVDESRPILTGVLVETNKKGFSMVATDGFRLGFCQVKVEGQQEPGGLKFIIPAKALSEIAKIISESNEEKGVGVKVKMMVSDNLSQVVFKINNVEFTSRLIEGVFPNWEKLIPSTFSSKAKLNRGEFLRLIKIASIFSRDSGNIVKLSLENGGKTSKLSVNSTTAQVGSSESEVPIAMDGKGGEIAFNYRYLIEALTTIGEEDVNFEMNESLNPGKITGTTDDNFFHIIMPVRLQN